ncbi:MAG: peptide-methionine (R)-S-oxide reductase MsrB [Candidatus Solibacter usitatus]|nr:peptide-methionine (R)-S-oxide reductase MsrB [Candidatus Solibacter usitatus]
MDRIVKSEDEWKKQLNRDQFLVTRKQGTERAFTGTFAKHHADGLYRCVCCGTALFDSKTKFESGTGWPSFFAPIAKENVREKTDRSLGVERTEVECTRCDGHLGHVFPDGPPPTRLRYCMNSVSLRFIARKRSPR